MTKYPSTNEIKMTKPEESAYESNQFSAVGTTKGNAACCKATYYRTWQACILCHWGLVLLSCLGISLFVIENPITLANHCQNESTLPVDLVS